MFATEIYFVHNQATLSITNSKREAVTLTRRE